MERWREAPTSSTWALRFVELFAECPGTDRLDPVLRGRQRPGVDQSLRAVGFFDPDEVELLEFREPKLDCPSGDAELFLESPVPEPAGVRAEAVEISEEVFLCSV
jgi:hypothetical protein